MDPVARAVRSPELQSTRLAVTTDTRSMRTPRIPGLTPTFSDRQDNAETPYIKVRSQRNADGTESHIWEKWVAFNVDPMYLALFARYDPGMVVRHHGHYSPHTLLVLGGTVRCGEVDLQPGDHVELPIGASFGPFEAGPDGAELYEVMMGDPRSWSDDEDSMAALLAARGIEQLPDPPIDLPGGLEDLRKVYARAEQLAAEAGPDPD